MAEDAESHTLRLLQDMRADMQGMRSDMRGLRAEMVERFDDVGTRIDGLTHMIVLLAANMGGHEDRLDLLETRVEALEAD